MVNFGGWLTNMTADWINSLAPVHVNISYNKGWCWESWNRESSIMHSQEDNIFKFDAESRRWVFQNPVPTITHKAKRKELNAARKLYAPFINYVKNISKLTDNGNLNLGREDRKAGYYLMHAKTVEERLAIAKSSDPEAHFALLGFLCYGKQSPLKRLDVMIITQHRDEVLEKVIHTDGRIRFDTYKWAFA